MPNTADGAAPTTDNLRITTVPPAETRLLGVAQRNRAISLPTKTTTTGRQFQPPTAKEWRGFSRISAQINDGSYRAARHLSIHPNKDGVHNASFGLRNTLGGGLLYFDL
jgi:hypothetical protein